MTQEQFAHFWPQLHAPFKAKWTNFTKSDLAEVQGNLATFTDLVHQRYGAKGKDEVNTWADRRHAYWSGNYFGYKDPEPVC